MQSTQKLRAVLCDSDGLLVDSERLFFEATRAAFETHGVAVTCDHGARWYLGEGKRSRDIARLLGMPSTIIESVIEKRDELFWARVDVGTPVLPGVKETLRRLAAHFQLAVVTGASREHFERVHSTTELRGYFEAVITCDDYQNAKPHPEPYLTALEKLRLEPCECVSIEDSPRGAAAAIAAGIRCFVVPTPLTDVSLCPAGCTVLNPITQLAEHLCPERFYS